MSPSDALARNVFYIIFKMYFKASLVFCLLVVIWYLVDVISFKSLCMGLLLIKSLYYYFYQMRYDLYVSDSPISKKLIE